MQLSITTDCLLFGKYELNHDGHVVVIPYVCIANAYFPPASSKYVQPMEDRQRWVDNLEARGPSVICGDFNAHHVSWDEYAQGMPRGTELYNWVKENEMAVLNDGKPTRVRSKCS